MFETIKASNTTLLFQTRNQLRAAILRHAINDVLQNTESVLTHYMQETDQTALTTNCH